MRRCENSWCVRNCSNHKKMKRWGNQCSTPALPCLMEGIDQNQNVINVLQKPIKEAQKFVMALTDAELSYCIYKEVRKSGKALLLEEELFRKKKKQLSQIESCQRARGAK